MNNEINTRGHHTAVIGEPGTKKSVFLYHQVHRLIRQNRPFIAIDTGWYHYSSRGGGGLWQHLKNDPIIRRRIDEGNIHFFQLTADRDDIPQGIHEHLKRGESVIMHIEGREDKRWTAASLIYRLTYSFRELNSSRPEQPYPLLIDGLRPFVDEKGGWDWAEALKKWKDWPVNIVFTLESLHQLPCYAFRETMKQVSTRAFFRPIYSCTDHTAEMLDNAYTPEELFSLEPGQFIYSDGRGAPITANLSTVAVLQ